MPRELLEIFVINDDRRVYEVSNLTSDRPERFSDTTQCT